jgi:O-antigen/teichoic acid export membrane protein
MHLTAKLLLPAMITMALLGRYVLGVFGPQYAKAGIGLLLVLTLAAIPDAITNIQVAVLRVERRLRAAAILTCSMALVALIGGWALAPEGITAIGVAWLAAQSLGSAWVAWDRRARARQEAVA